MSFTTKKIISFYILFIFTILHLSAQNIITDLMGFRIGQYREVAGNELGAPLQKDKFDDGFQYELFLLKPDTSLYIIFEYAAGRTDIIWSIQLSGIDGSVSTGFKNIKLGMDKSQVTKSLGKPSQKVDVGEYGERWVYEQTNYSLEINPEGKLASIKISDNYSGAKSDVNKLPSFTNVVKKLNSSNNLEIASVLSPTTEIFYLKKSLYFRYSMKTEIEKDPSKLFQTIKILVKNLDKVNTKDSTVYEENIRLIHGQNPLHVIKIKSGHPIREIVFQYLNGQYLIWEIIADKI